MDVRIRKGPGPLHTTGGLSTAKASMNTGENKIFITAECRIKSTAKKDQKTTDPDCGTWGRPWAKEDYLSGTEYFFSLSMFVVCPKPIRILEVLDDYLRTLNASWANSAGHGMELIR